MAAPVRRNLIGFKGCVAAFKSFDKGQEKVTPRLLLNEVLQCYINLINFRFDTISD